MLAAGGGTLNPKELGRIIAFLVQQRQQPGGTPAPAPVPAPAPGTGAGSTPSDPTMSDGASGNNSFMNYFYPASDLIGLGAGVIGRSVGAYYKSKAAKQIARGNAPQHIAAALDNPQSAAIFGSPLTQLTGISGDAGQAAATKSLATGEAVQGSLQDVSNFISSINMMRRLMSGNALSAMGLIALQRMATQQRGP
jgi:hypothetical protein